MKLHEHRKFLMDAIERVVDGHALKRWSSTTIYGPGHCAQLVRETDEGQLGFTANTSPIAVLAHEYRKKRGGTVRWATDYEQAAEELGLAKLITDMQPGDNLYWPYSKNGNRYGHTAKYAGNGYVLENSDADPEELVARGAKQPLGKGTQVFLTPLRLRGEPRTVAWPSAELRDAERPPVPASAPVPAKAPRRVMVNTGKGEWVNLAGKTITIRNAPRVVINTKHDRDVWIRYLNTEEQEA